MIKIENEQINIYSKPNKNSFIEGLQLIGIALLLLLFIFFIAVQGITKLIVLFIFGVILVLLLLAIKKIKLKEFEEKLVFSLSKEKFTIFKKNENEVYYTNKILKFVNVQDYNMVNLIYLNDKNKKKTKLFTMRGCSNLEFINLANEFIKNGIPLNQEKIDEKELEQKQEIIYLEDLKSEMLENKELKCIFLGKTKIFMFKGDSYQLEKLRAEIYFLLPNKKILALDLNELEIEWKDLSLDNYYKLSLKSLKENVVVAEKMDEIHDLKEVDDFKNNTINIVKFLFDENKINIEVSFQNKLIKITNIIKILVLISCIIFLVIRNLSFLAISISIILFLVFPIAILVCSSKCKKLLFSK